MKIQSISKIAFYLLPTLAVVSCGWDKADDFAKSKGKEIQQICKTQKKCPEKIIEWTEPLNETSTTDNKNVKSVSTTRFEKYPVNYAVSDDGLEFEIIVRHTIDTDFIVEGGANKNLTYKDIDSAQLIREVPAD